MLGPRGSGHKILVVYLLYEGTLKNRLEAIKGLGLVLGLRRWECMGWDAALRPQFPSPAKACRSALD